MGHQILSRTVHAVLIITLLYLPMAIPLAASPLIQGDGDITSLVKLTVSHYAAQKDLYAEGEGEIVEGEGELVEGEGEVVEGEGEDVEGEGELVEGEGEDESLFLPWQQYATIGGVIALAFGILWVAEEPPSPCMVATAAYGTPLSGKITILRLFRDRILLNSAAGTAFVDVYYRLGMGAASFVAQHSWAAVLVRLALLPVLAIASVVLLFPGGSVVAGYVLLLLCALIVLYWMARARGWRAPAAQGTLKRRER